MVQSQITKRLACKKKKKGKKITFFFLKPFLENDDSKLLLYVKGKKKGYLVQLSLTKSDDGDGWHRHQSFHFNSNVLCTLVQPDSRGSVGIWVTLTLLQFLETNSTVTMYLYPKFNPFEQGITKKHNKWTSSTLSLLLQAQKVNNLNRSLLCSR